MGAATEVTGVGVASHYIHVGVIKDVEPLRAEFEAHAFRQRERLAECHVEVPRARAPKSVSGGHIRRIGPEVRYAIQRRIAETARRGQVQQVKQIGRRSRDSGSRIVIGNSLNSGRNVA